MISIYIYKNIRNPNWTSPTWTPPPVTLRLDPSTWNSPSGFLCAANYVHQSFPLAGQKPWDTFFWRYHRHQSEPS